MEVEYENEREIKDYGINFTCMMRRQEKKMGTKWIASSIPQSNKKGKIKIEKV